MDGQHFDELTRRLARRASRRGVMRGLAAALLTGVGLGRVGTDTTRAQGNRGNQGGNSACADFCRTVFNGREAGQCMATAAKGDGPCYQCGPAARAGNGLILCGTRCIPACTALDDQCMVGVCNESTGQCEAQPINEGQSCDDGDACTQTDTCQNGLCVGSNPIVCTASDQCHVAGTCDPSTGICSNLNAPDNTPCNDDNVCTSGDSCQSGICTGGASVVCTTDNPCLTASCDPVQGCITTPKTNGTACDADSDACTVGDACDGAGSCVAGQPISCGPCLRCNTTNGTCEADPNQVGQSCPGDGNLCFGGFQCNASGSCVGVEPVVCTAQDQCHAAGTCDPSTGVCSNPDAPDNTPCFDRDSCTQTDTCQSGVCVGSNPVVCPACQTCYRGSCVADASQDGDACGDSNQRICESGQCKAPCVPKTCNPESDDTRDPPRDCGVHTDGCGGYVACGGCPDGYFCGGRGTCQSSCGSLVC